MSEQVAAARASVLVVHDPDSAVLVAAGSDRETWLNGLLTCDVTKARIGEASYGLAVSQKGRVVADVFVIKEAERILLLVPRAVRDELAIVLERYLIMEDAELAKDESPVAFAHGPRAKDLGGASCDRTGLGGAVFVGDAALDERAIAAGGIVGDASGWEALRLERGVARFGVDFDDKTYPQEASLEKRAVSFDKGCYLGQEVVCMLELRGHVKRKLVGFVSDGAKAARAAGATITAGSSVTTDDGVEVGKVSSAIDSPTLGHPVGLAMVKLAVAAPGTSLRIGNAVVRVVDGPVG